jgi:hypothetical protein
MNAAERDESAPGANGTRIFVLGDDPESSDSPAVVMLEMPPNYVLFRHAHICHRFEVVVKGSLEAGGRILRPGDVMTAPGRDVRPAHHRPGGMHHGRGLRQS